MKGLLPSGRSRRTFAGPRFHSFKDVDFGDKAISLTNHRPDKARISRIVAQDGTQLVYRSINTVFCLNKDIVAPQLFDNRFSADKFAGVFQQQDQQLHRNALQLDVVAGTQQLTALSIELKLIKAEAQLRHSGAPSWT